MSDTSHNLNIGELCLEERIREGIYREVYRRDDYALKIIKPYMERIYGLFHIKIPTSLYTKLKFGISDFNRYEYHNYLGIISQVHEEVKDSFAQIFGIMFADGYSISINELIVNADGKVSKTLKEFGQVTDSTFWRRLQKLEELFLSKNIPYFDIRPENILVKELGDGHMIPVLIDYKRVGIRTYPLQLNLLTKSGILKKIKGRFSKLREQYKIN